MAHFYGELQGNRGRASRLGTKKSGLDTIAASWHGCVRVSLFYDEKTGVDWCHVALDDWQGQGKFQLLYHGPVSGLPVPTKPATDDDKPLFDD